MPELAVRPDPSVWTLVPDVDSDPDAAASWLEALVERAPAQRRSAVADAAFLALRERVGGAPSMVLLLTASEHAVLATLSLYDLADVPPPADTAAARSIAASLLESEWALQLVAGVWGDAAGWRVTALDASEGADGVTVADAVETAYLLSCGGRLVIGLLPPLPPAHAAIAQTLAERVLTTLEIVTEDDVR